MFLLVLLFFIAILVLLKLKLKLKLKSKLKLKLKSKLKLNPQYGGKKSMFSKETIVRARAAVAKARAKDNEDPYAWIRPMYIVDIFRKFWLTR
jgi:hypothetical protein